MFPPLAWTNRISDLGGAAKQLAVCRRGHHHFCGGQLVNRDLRAQIDVSAGLNKGPLKMRNELCVQFGRNARLLLRFA